MLCMPATIRHLRLLQGSSLRCGVVVSAPSSLNRPHGPDLRAQDTFALGLYVRPLSLRVYALTAHKSFRTFTADLSWHVVLWVPVEPIRCIHPVPSRTAPPSPFIDRLGTPNSHFGAYGFAIATTCQVASSPSRWTFTFELSDRSVTLPAVEYNYGANWTIYPGSG
jgi:hypothetical protein